MFSSGPQVLEGKGTQGAPLQMLLKAAPHVLDLHQRPDKVLPWLRKGLADHPVGRRQCRDTACSPMTGYSIWLT